MAIKRPAPKTLSKEEMAKVLEASQGQQAQTQIVKSYDDKFPVFDIPAGEKVLVYVPNHTFVSPVDGTTQLRCDRFGAHSVKDGKMFAKIRCTEGVESETLGLDGTCPLCTSVETCWDVYNKMYEDQTRAKGIDVSTDEGYKAAQPIRDSLRDKFAVQNKDIYLTFCFVVIECETKNGLATTVPKRDENGQLIGTPYFYEIREAKYFETWVKALDGLSVDTVLTHPAGTWAVLNYQVLNDQGAPIKNPSKKIAAKDFSVTYKQFPADFDQWARYFDQLTEGWTPEVMMENLVDNQMRSGDEMREVDDTLMHKTRELHSLLGLAGAKVEGITQTDGASAPAVGSPDQALANFGVTAGEPISADTAQSGAPVVDGAPVAEGAPVVTGAPAGVPPTVA